MLWRTAPTSISYALQINIIIPACKAQIAGVCCRETKQLYRISFPFFRKRETKAATHLCHVAARAGVEAGGEMSAPWLAFGPSLVELISAPPRRLLHILKPPSICCSFQNIFRHYWVLPWTSCTKANILSSEHQSSSVIGVSRLPSLASCDGSKFFRDLRG